MDGDTIKSEPKPVAALTYLLGFVSGVLFLWDVFVVGKGLLYYRQDATQGATRYTILDAKRTGAADVSSSCAASPTRDGGIR